MRPTVSVIIVSWETRDKLAAALRSLASCTLPLEVIVVDNGSRDGSVAMVRRDFPEVLLLVNEVNRGFGAANNQGMAIATGRYFFLLNSDAELRPRALEQMVAYAEAHPRVGVVGARLRYPDGRWQAEGMRFPSLGDELARMVGFDRLRPVGMQRGDSPYETDWVQGAAMLVRRKVWEEVGGFDESIFMYGEEMEWCARIRAAGWQIVIVPQAEIIHHGGVSVERVPLKRRALVYSGKRYFFLRHRGRLKATLFWLLVITTAIPKTLYWIGRARLSRGEARKKAQEAAQSYRRLLLGR